MRVLPLLALLLAAPAVAVAVENDTPALSLTLSVDRKEVFQGEVVPVSVFLKFSGSRPRNISFPTLRSPRLKGDAFAAPEEIPGTADDPTITYVFRGTFTPPSAGVVTIGPATLACEVPEDTVGSGGFFGGMEPRTVRLTSATVDVAVQALPKQGRPSYFQGAVGSFGMEVTARPASIAAGDPLTVTTTIHGEGDLASATCPELRGDHIKAYPPTGRHQRNRLICEQVILPSAGARLPAFQWSYFDPHSRKYETLRHSIPAAVHVQPPPPGQHAPPPPAVRAAAPPGKDAASGILPWSIVITVFTVVGISTRRLRRSPKACAAGHPSEENRSAAMTAEAESAVLSGDVEKFYRTAYSILQLSISNTIGAKPETVTSLPAVHVLDPGATALWDRCQQVLYGRERVNPSLMQDDLRLLLRLP